MPTLPRSPVSRAPNTSALSSRFVFPPPSPPPTSNGGSASAKQSETVPGTARIRVHGVNRGSSEPLTGLKKGEGTSSGSSHGQFQDSDEEHVLLCDAVTVSSGGQGKGTAVKGDRNSKGLALPLAAASSHSRGIFGILGADDSKADQLSQAQAPPIGKVASAISVLPLDIGTVVSPTLVRTSSSESSSSSVCKGGPGNLICGLEVKDGQQGVQCDWCFSWFHTVCQDVNKPAYNALKKHKSIAFLCSSCKDVSQHNPTKTTAREVGVQVFLQPDETTSFASSVQVCTQDPVNTQDQGIQTDLGLGSSGLDFPHLAKRVSDLEGALRSHMRLVEHSMREQEKSAQEHSQMLHRTFREINSHKASFADVVKGSCDSMMTKVEEKLANINHTKNHKPDLSLRDAQNISQVFDGFLDKNRRSRNIVVHNLPEQQGQSLSDRSKADMSLFVTMAKEVFRLNCKPTRSFRAGKVIPDRARLLIITLENEETKHEILSMAAQLRSSSNWTRVFITPDLTWSERQAQKKLREELRSRREAGEDGITIRRGKIVSLSMARKTPVQPSHPPNTAPTPNSTSAAATSPLQVNALVHDQSHNVPVPHQTPATEAHPASQVGISASSDSTRNTPSSSAVNQAA